MIDPLREDAETRVLILAPTGKDADLTQSILARAGVTSVRCAGFQQLCDLLATGGAAAVLIAEEAAQGRTGCLADWLSCQPPWSDLPVLVLARPGADSAAVARAMDQLGNVTVLERPMRVAALVSAVRTALRARQRQYATRSNLSQIDASEQRFRNIFQSAGVSLWEEDFSGVKAALEGLRARGVTDLDRYFAEHPEFVQQAMGAIRVLDVNDATVTMFGAEDKRELLGSLPKIFVAESMPVFLEELKAVAEGRTYLEAEALLNTVRGSPVHVFFTMVLPGSGQPYDRVLFSVVDITARKRTEDLLREADRRKDEFLAVLAHELRNPLAPIRNSLEILRLTAQTDRAERAAEMMERQVSHMVRLVDDLLEVSRITRGQIDLRKERVSIASVVSSAVEASKPLIEAAGHRLALAIPAEALTVEGDPVRLAQVVGNLLNNAAKYTEAGGRIWLTVRREDEWVTISVRDTGRGISPEQIPRVFDLFMQVDSDAGRTQGGLGIGLALVKSLVEMHGGSVKARSEGLGRGSEFLFRLPLAARQSETDEPRNGDDHRTVLGPTRVLVVDDNRDAAESLGMLLELLGALVRVVYNGHDALEACAAFQPAVVLLDIGMPGMDGHEVARRIRQRSELEGVTLIALTGWGQEEDRQRSRTAGFDHHLTKPADIGALQTLVLSLAKSPRH